MPRPQRQASGSQRFSDQDLSIPMGAPMYTSNPRITMSAPYVFPQTANADGSMPIVPPAFYEEQSAPPVMPPVPHRASSGAWSLSDDQQLLTARMQGLNWGQIKDQYFPSKTGNACRKRHERLMERKGSDDWDNRNMEKIAKEYMSMRKEIWQGLAARTGEKWSLVEQKCLSNGLKNLQSHARAASRRERERERAGSATGATFSGYDDDSGISGIGLTPVEELDASYGSPETSASSGGHSASSRTAGRYVNAPPSHLHHHSHNGPLPSYPNHSHTRSHSTAAQLQPPIQSFHAGYSMSGYHGDYVPAHGYSSSVSSSASAYGHGMHHGERSPYPRADDY